MAPSPAQGAGWPAVDSPPRTGARATQDAAVLAGVNGYAALPFTPYGHRDADAAGLFLMFTRGVPVAAVHRVRDPSEAALARALATACAQVGPEGTLWLWLSGHGATVGGARAWLAADAPRAPTGAGMSGVVALDDVIDVALRSAARRVVVVVDGSAAAVDREGQPLWGGAEPATRWEPLADPRLVVVSAGSADEVAADLHDARQSRLAWAVLGGLHGWADGASGAPRDGSVTVGELVAWLEAGLPAALGQSPRAWTWGDREEVLSRGRLAAAPDFSALSPLNAPTMPDAVAPRADAEGDAARARDALEARIRQEIEAQAQAAFHVAIAERAAGDIDALDRFVARFRTLRVPLADGDVYVRPKVVDDALALLARAPRPGMTLATVTLPAGTVRVADGRGVRTVRLGRPSVVTRERVSFAVWATVPRDRPTPLRAGPITGVSWNDAVDFANALSRLDGLAPAYLRRGGVVEVSAAADGWRLPTADELAAARALGVEVGDEWVWDAVPDDPSGRRVILTADGGRTRAQRADAPAGVGFRLVRPTR